MENKEEKEKPIEIGVDNFNWQIPECCREGWDSCQHVVNRPRPVKGNVGL